MEFAKHVKVRQEKFGAVVFETLREKVFVTNETGAEILSLLEEKEEPKEVTAELAKKYCVDSKLIESDVNGLISILEEKGIIKNKEQQ
tara:strand:+ start:318 stop:581 length:264 start_codon:yes stop_codon:yes gene_type:complete